MFSIINNYLLKIMKKYILVLTLALFVILSFSVLSAKAQTTTSCPAGCVCTGEVSVCEITPTPTTCPVNCVCENGIARCSACGGNNVRCGTVPAEISTTIPAEKTTDVCCELFGYGANMIKTPSTYEIMSKEKCLPAVIPPGGGRNIVANSFCKAQTCPNETIECVKGTSAESYVGKDGCMKFKCISSNNDKIPTTEKGGSGTNLPNSQKIFMSKTANGQTLIKSETSNKPDVPKEGKNIPKNEKKDLLPKANINTEVTTTEKVSIVNSKLTMETSSGQSKTIEIMPEEIANILKVDTVQKAELTQAAEKPIYVVEGNKEGKILWVFPKNMNIEAKVDAENGEVIFLKKPWWNFLFR